jgi:hypothetical protein
MADAASWVNITSNEVFDKLYSVVKCVPVQGRPRRVPHNTPRHPPPTTHHPVSPQLCTHVYPWLADAGTG